MKGQHSLVVSTIHLLEDSNSIRHQRHQGRRTQHQYGLIGAGFSDYAGTKNTRGDSHSQAHCVVGALAPIAAILWEAVLRPVTCSSSSRCQVGALTLRVQGRAKQPEETLTVAARVTIAN